MKPTAPSFESGTRREAEARTAGHAGHVHDQPLLVANTPETRECRMRFWDKGEPNGDWTPVQRTTLSA